jgi:hypothetical protein
MPDDVKDKASKILSDLKRAKSVKRNWLDEAEEDFAFAVGKQWRDEDKTTLERAGVPALTINKIQPNIFLVSGYQRQNRPDIVAYPEGDEDNLYADIVTRLIKNAVKLSMGELKLSEQFEDGVICGEGWVEPYIDYSNDLINGELFIKKVNPLNIFVDPASIEYDLSDAEYVIKVSPGLTKNQVLKLFPDKKSIINKISNGTLSINSGDNSIKQTLDYPMVSDFDGKGSGEDYLKEDVYDLVEYQYKKYVSKYIVADKEIGDMKEAKDKEEAQMYVDQKNTIAGQIVAKVIERIVPEIWICSLVGDTVVDEYISPFYPKWKGYSLIPFFAHRITVPIKNGNEFRVQGIVRSLKDPQRELNKRRSQELRILNSTANSGWLAEQDTWVKKSDVEKYGSTPGVTLEYKAGKQRPERITPAPLSQGHAQLAAENTQDIKEISGINADLLAMNDKQASGRAIHLRQQQGIVMLQRILDNFSYTTKLLGRFIMSQLGEIYTVERAVKVCGTAFVKDNFSKPVLAPGIDGQPTPVMDPSGQMQMEVDQEGVVAVFNTVLNDTDIGKYDVTVDEANNSPTVKYGNYLILAEMAEKGMPIPPDVLIDESMIGEASKQKIKKSIAAMQSQNAMPGASPVKGG